jgi:predicted unusual protein kinase regulating ubiquinone biosynthesis (AarF/ABC1/UbiB family)
MAAAKKPRSLAIQISETNNFFDEAAFRRQIAIVVAEQKDNNLAEIEVGKAVLMVSHSAADNGLFVPSELTLLGKTLMQLDQVGLTLDPKFNPNAAVRQHVAEILNQRMKQNFTAGKVMASVLELKDFIRGLPPKVNKILDAVGEAKLQIQIRPRDTNFLLFGVQKIANRITAGLILARADRRRGAVDAGRNAVSAFWISGAGYNLFPGRRVWRIDPALQHFLPGSKE